MCIISTQETPGHFVSTTPMQLTNMFVPTIYHIRSYPSDLGQLSALLWCYVAQSLRKNLIAQLDMLQGEDNGCTAAAKGQPLRIRWNNMSRNTHVINPTTLTVSKPLLFINHLSVFRSQYSVGGNTVLNNKWCEPTYVTQHINTFYDICRPFMTRDMT